MSRLTLREEGLLVVDDFLPPQHLSALRSEIAQGDFRGVHAQKWDKAWRLWDGQPLRGTSVYYDPERLFGYKGPNYPTATAIDSLIDGVCAISREHTGVAGAQGVDWLALYLSPWLYPRGSALSQHRDGSRYSGSFAFFAHARWNLHWGGELLASHHDAAGPTIPFGAPDAGDEPWISDDVKDEDCGAGLATCVSPWPNRLVLLGPDRPHRIARIDDNAGAHLRASIAGFFLRAP